MIEQLKTIRDFIESAYTTNWPRVEDRNAAHDAIEQLEAMVGEQEPVAYIHRQGKHWEVAERPLLDDEKARGWIEEPLYTAAPVAQQYEAGDMASAAAQGFRDGVASVAQPQEPVAYYYQKHNCFGQLVWNVGFVAPGDATHCYPLYTAAPVAQQHVPEADCGNIKAQQQAKPHKPLFADLIAQHPGLREELLEMDKQPQAEAAPNTLQKAEAHLLNLIGEYWGLAYAEGEEGRNHDTEDGAAQRTHAAIAKAVKDLIAAASSTPQQAEAVPSDWTPTHTNINALPSPVRAYIHDLVANADPTGTVRDLSIAKQTIRELEASNRMLRDKQAEAVPSDVLGSEWAPCIKRPVVVHVRNQRPGEKHVSTREGITPVKPDDLIMRGVSGEEYPIGRTIFEQTYDFVDAAIAQQKGQP